jgi:chemotaxis protein CheX
VGAENADVLPIMIQDMDELVNSAATEVFETMLSIKLAPEPLEQAANNNGQGHIAGSVGFIGRLSGVVYIHATESLAKTITSTLLGLSEPEIEGNEMVNDAMGEMANMIVGHMKSRLSDRGMPCVLTIPSVVRGSNFSVEAVSSTEGRIYAYACRKDHLLIELLLKPLQ